MVSSLMLHECPVPREMFYWVQGKEKSDPLVAEMAVEGHCPRAALLPLFQFPFIDLRFLVLVEDKQNEKSKENGGDDQGDTCQPSSRERQPD